MILPLEFPVPEGVRLYPDEKSLDRHISDPVACSSPVAH
jgi:hypothetical protein